MKRLFLSTVCLLSLPTLADNNRGFYAGAGLTYTEAFDYPGVEDPVKIKSVELLAGYKYNNLLGVEVRYGGGYDSTELDTSIPTPADDEGAEAQIADTEYEIDNYYSIYYKPELINDEARLYGLIGYTSMDRTVKFNNSALAASYISHSPTFDPNDEINEDGEITNSNSGFSYGIGAGWFVNKHFNINVEYRILMKTSDERLSTAGIYFDYRI